MSADIIEKKILLRAPRERVWRAISDASEFGTWFGIRFEGPFAPGASVRGVMVPNMVDPEIAEAQKPYAGTSFSIEVERIEPEHLFSFRWNPCTPEPGAEELDCPSTLVEFVLEEAEGGVMLTVTESGFDRIPLERRAKAFSDNEGGWTMMVRCIEKYVSQQHE